jgi:hypothetical protein
VWTGRAGEGCALYLMNLGRPLNDAQKPLVELGKQYGQNAPAACATWTPTTFERYPAVLDSGGDRCRLMTGVADQAVLLVNDVAQPECRRATEIATVALTTLREAP